MRDNPKPRDTLKAVSCSAVLLPDHDEPLIYVVTFEDGSIWEFDASRSSRVCMWDPNSLSGNDGVFNRRPKMQAKGGA